MKKIISSRLQITLIMMIFIVPLLVFLIIYNLYTINTLNRRIAQTGKETISVYQNSLEKGLSNAVEQMQYFAGNDLEFKMLCCADDSKEIYLFSTEVINKINLMISANYSITATYLYAEKNELLFDVYNDNIPFLEKLAIREELTKVFKDNEFFVGNDWFVHTIGDKNYLLRVFHYNNIYLTYVTDLSRIETAFFSLNEEDSLLFYTNQDYRVLTKREIVQKEEIELLAETDADYYLTGKQQKYMVVQKYFNYGNFNFVYAMPYSGVWSGFNNKEILLVIFSIIICILMFISFKLLKIWYFNPLQNLSAIMTEIKNGKVDLQMPTHKNILEFNMFSDAFNEMMDQIKSLKISAYEQELESQQAKLQYLQIQIRPHFFLNCLKNIYALAQEGKDKQIQDMTLALASYLRFIFKNNLILIPLSEELENVKNYILLQKMSANYPISCDINVDSKLADYEIPPLTISTFVENTIKHAGVSNKHLMIYIEVSVVESANESLVNIRVIDNGVGFPEAILQKLNGTIDYHYQEKQVGIQNVRHRCDLIYKQQCKFVFSNIIGGACVEIFLPLNKNRKGEVTYECFDGR